MGNHTPMGQMPVGKMVFDQKMLSPHFIMGRDDLKKKVLKISQNL
jgi:hypothetical protein